MRLGSLRRVKEPSCRRRLLNIANEIHVYTSSFETSSVGRNRTVNKPFPAFSLYANYRIQYAFSEKGIPNPSQATLRQGTFPILKGRADQSQQVFISEMLESPKASWLLLTWRFATSDHDRGDAEYGRLHRPSQTSLARQLVPSWQPCAA